MFCFVRNISCILTSLLFSRAETFFSWINFFHHGSNVFSRVSRFLDQFLRSEGPIKYPQEQPPEAFYKKRCSKKFRKIHRKALVPESHFKQSCRDFFYRTPLGDCFCALHSFVCFSKLSFFCICLSFTGDTVKK